MLSWFVRILLIAAGSLVELFVARDSPNFSTIQTVTTLLLVVLIVYVLGYWPSRWTDRINRIGKNSNNRQT